MRVIAKSQNSKLNNDSIKWYLLDETLWVTKCNGYADFGFIIINDQLEGWILKNASKHIYIE